MQAGLKAEQQACCLCRVESAAAGNENFVPGVLDGAWQSVMRSGPVSWSAWPDRVGVHQQPTS